MAILQPWLKLIFLLLSTPIIVLGSSSPNPKIPLQQLVKYPMLLHLKKFLSRFMLWWWIIVEFTMSCLASRMCPAILARHITRLLVHSQDPEPVIARVGSLSPGFCIGASFMLLGNLIRILCFASLARFFTFEQRIHKDHRLITTGPYTIVRHPSYTGAIIFLSGFIQCLIHKSSWLVTCSGWFPHDEHALNHVLWGLQICFVLPVLSFYRRVRWARGEDAMLKKHFGKEWEDWASRVPYKMIALVY